MCVLALAAPHAIAQEDSSAWSADEIRESAERILSQPEFQRFRRVHSRLKESESLDRERRKRERDESESSFRMPRFFESIAGGIAAVFHIVAWIGIGVVCALIVYLIVRAFGSLEPLMARERTGRAGPEQGEEDEERSPAEIPPDVYLQRAMELAREGRYGEAMAQLLLGTMAQIERAGLIRYRRGLTHRDYLRAVRGQDELYQPLRNMVRLYEPVGFGRRPATPDHFERSLADYRMGFHET